MWRRNTNLVDKKEKKGENFVFEGEKKFSFKELKEVMNINYFSLFKNMLLSKVKKVFHISTDLIVLISI